MQSQNTNSYQPHLYITGISIANRDDNPIFGENATKLKLQDEAAGMFLEIIQEGSDFNGMQMQTVRLNFEDIPKILEGIHILQGESEKYDKVQNHYSFGKSKNSILPSVI